MATYNNTRSFTGVFAKTEPDLTPRFLYNAQGGGGGRTRHRTMTGSTTKIWVPPRLGTPRGIVQLIVLYVFCR